MKTKIANVVVKILKYILFLNKPNRFSCFFYEKIDLFKKIKTKEFDIKISTPNIINNYRANTFFTKEPDMINWLDRLDKDSLLMDVGANIGLYSIYAAKKNIRRVIAIEPESQNFGILNKNIYINNLSEKITALNIGFSDKDGLEDLFIPMFMTGAALNNLGSSEDFNKDKFKADFKQSVITYSIDSFLEKFPEHFPSHLKIDVDGIESKIIKGANKTLDNKKLKEVIIELNEDLKEDLEVIKILKSKGFELSSKAQCPIADSQFDILSNYIFIRK